MAMFFNWRRVGNQYIVASANFNYRPEHNNLELESNFEQSSCVAFTKSIYREILSKNYQPVHEFHGNSIFLFKITNVLTQESHHATLWPAYLENSAGFCRLPIWMKNKMQISTNATTLLKIEVIKLSSVVLESEIKAITIKSEIEIHRFDLCRSNKFLQMYHCIEKSDVLYDRNGNKFTVEEVEPIGSFFNPSNFDRIVQMRCTRNRTEDGGHILKIRFASRSRFA